MWSAEGVPGLLCAKTRFVSIAAIPHILFHMCRQIGFALRATTKRGGLPSGFAAGTARRRFDLKVELQAIRLPFDIPAPSTFVKRRRAIPTFGSRQAPRHERRLRGTRISTNGVTMPIALQSTCCSGKKPPDIRARASAPNMPAWVMQRLLPLHKYLGAPIRAAARGEIAAVNVCYGSHFVAMKKIGPQALRPKTLFRVGRALRLDMNPYDGFSAHCTKFRRVAQGGGIC